MWVIMRFIECKHQPFRSLIQALQGLLEIKEDHRRALGLQGIITKDLQGIITKDTTN
jgi:hypothetical protein